MLKAFSVRSQLVQVNSCTLLEQEAIAYECTVCGEGATIWTGSLFNCTSNEIILSHRLLEGGSASGARGDCNNGAVTAHSIGVLRENNINCYISQLQISMNTDINNKTVTCTYVYGLASETVIDTASIGYISGKLQRNNITEYLLQCTECSYMSAYYFLYLESSTFSMQLYNYIIITHACIM